MVATELDSTWRLDKQCILCALALGQDRKGNGTQVLSYPPTLRGLCWVNIQFTRKASHIFQRTTRLLSWNRPFFLSHRIQLPAPITTGSGRSEVGCLDAVLSFYSAERWDHESVSAVQFSPPGRQLPSSPPACWNPSICQIRPTFVVRSE